MFDKILQGYRLTWNLGFGYASEECGRAPPTLDRCGGRRFLKMFDISNNEFPVLLLQRPANISQICQLK